MTVMVEWATHLKPMNNSREHPMARHARVKKQRETTHLLLKTNRVIDRLGSRPPGHRLLVTFVRIAARRLDPGDNHNSSFKSIRDEVAAHFGVNDGNEGSVRFDYAPHIKGPSACRIILAWERLPSGAVIHQTELATTPREWAKRGLLSSGVVRNR